MLIITLLLLDLLKENAYAADASVYCPDKVFTDNTVTYLTGSFNSSVLTTGKCVFNVSEVKFVLINGTSNPVPLCTQTFSTSPIMCDTNFTTQNCKCDNVTGEMFYYTYRFTTNASVHEGIVIELTTDCVDINGEYPLTIQTCSITFKATTTAPTTTTIYTSEATTKAPNCTDNCPQRSKCPDWCIAVSVCVPVGGGLIITITVIIIKKKKAKTPGSSVQDTKEMQDRTKHHGTENRPTPAQGGNNRTEERPTPAQSGNNRTEESVQDTKEMQDRSKHLGTDNSPEREKRRKKKKKKKTFQEVDGESVSRENKSTVNDHKAAQNSPNDNSVSVNENSPITYNGELRRLPVPNIPHMTSVERNSTYFQSETPRKLPPLQPKAMIIP